MGIQSEVRALWSFGLQAGAGGAVLGSTGTGTRIPTFALARESLLYIETPAACTCSYQVLTARTSTGTGLVLSSGTMAAASVDVIHLTGPYPFLYPRIKTMTDTTTTLVVELFGN